MINSIEEYLRQLKKEMNGCDRATIQDALSDSEEYLRNALESKRQANPSLSGQSALEAIIEEYGNPGEIAEAYRKVESRSSPSLTAEPYKKAPTVSPEATEKVKASLWKKFFGVVIDPRAWGALLYLLFALVTGIIYFTWTVTGISLSLGLLVLIIGIPIAGLFILSTRGLALLEGRMVEALLGIRMPHRPLFSQKAGLWGKFKMLVADKYSWLSMLYMILQLPLGIIYFSVFISLFAVSLYLILTPLLELAWGIPLFTSHYAMVFLSNWMMPVAVIAGALLFILTLHLAKITGKLHGNMAKAMLVRD